MLKVAAACLRFRPGQNARIKTASASVISSGHQRDGGSRRTLDRGGAAKETVALVEGGSVVTVTTVEAGAPLERLTGETGFIEQDAPAIPDTSQVNATVLETLPCGVTDNVATPVRLT